MDITREDTCQPLLKNEYPSRYTTDPAAIPVIF